MDVGLIITLTFIITVALSLLVWHVGGIIFAWKNRIGVNLDDLTTKFKARKDVCDHETTMLEMKVGSLGSRVLALEENLRDAQVIRLEPKTGAFLHTDESEAAAEKEAGIGEPLEIGGSKSNGKKFRFADLGGVDAFDRPTMEEVSENAGKETGRTRTDL